MRPTLTLFAGKGGVGKTTCAAAHAVAAASAGARVLVLSTDPAHSLSDVLAVSLSHRPRRLRWPRGRGRHGGSLEAAEIDARRAFSRWLGAHRRALGDIIEQGTWLDRADVEALLGLSIPGVDELVGLIEISRLAGAGYDRVVVDTAPTGHTLRLLDAPATVTAVARVLDVLYEEHRVIRDQLARVGRPEAGDRLIALLADQAAEAAALLRDSARVRVRWITLPEVLSLAEARDGISVLERLGIRVDRLIVNAVTPDGSPCPVCDRSRTSERRVIRDIRRHLGRGRTLVVVHAQPFEPRGLAALAPIGRSLETPAQAGQPRARGRRSPNTIVFSAPERVSVPAAETLRAFRDLELLFVGGKGGAGKTTVAATLALTLARADARPTLLLSTDPAHSLGDVLDQPVGDRLVRVVGGPPNLRAREIDAVAALRGRRARLAAALEEIIGAAGVGPTVREHGAGELMDLAPPGMDELFGLLSVVEASARFSRVVVDMAPTGHALRLLAMPDEALAWVRLLLQVLLKYRSVVRPGQLGAELVELSRSIRALQTGLRDPKRTGFIVVTRAAGIARAETARLFARLKRLRLPTSALIVNAMTLAPGRCSRCCTSAIRERCELARFTRDRQVARRWAIIQTPRAAPPVRGASGLERWAMAWNVAAAGR